VSQKEDCECTVTIIRIPEDKRWWNPACTKRPKKPAMNPKSLDVEHADQKTTVLGQI
jgi:hypothetical protein